MTEWMYRLAVLCGLSIFAAGCLSTPTIELIQYYTIDPALQPAALASTGKSLGIRPLVGARPYQLQVAYKEEPNRLAYFFRAEWAESPPTLVTRALSDALNDLGAFTDVGDAANMTRPDYVLTGELRRFEADYTAEPCAVVEVSFAIRETSGTAAQWEGIVQATAPLSGGPDSADLEEVAAALSDAVTQLVAEICQQIAG